MTLNPPEISERIAYAREPSKLPVIPGADEVVRFLEAVPSLKTHSALTTAYSAGLRASETVGPKVADIDSGRMLIQVRHGKGAKDRSVMLSAQLLAILRTDWRLARPKVWLFPGREESKTIDVQVLHAACRSAAKAAGLGSGATSRSTIARCGTSTSGIDRFRGVSPGPRSLDIRRPLFSGFEKAFANHRSQSSSPSANSADPFSAVGIRLTLTSCNANSTLGPRPACLSRFFKVFVGVSATLRHEIFQQSSFECSGPAKDYQVFVERRCRSCCHEP